MAQLIQPLNWNHHCLGLKAVHHPPPMNWSFFFFCKVTSNTWDKQKYFIHVFWNIVNICIRYVYLYTCIWVYITYILGGTYIYICIYIYTYIYIYIKVLTPQHKALNNTGWWTCEGRIISKDVKNHPQIRREFHVVSPCFRFPTPQKYHRTIWSWRTSTYNPLTYPPPPQK